MEDFSFKLTDTRRTAESGNVFWYLFLCAALLGTLTYAIAQGGRSSVTSLSEDKQELLAADIVAYADIVGKAVTQLRLRGTLVSEISFANSFLSAGEYGTYNADPQNEIFNPDGGAVVYTSPAALATVSGTEEFMFLSGNEIEQVGTTCGDASCSDLIMVLDNVRTDICTKINDIIGVTNPSNTPPTDSDIDLADKYIAGNAFTHNEVIGDEDLALEGQREACFEKADSDNTYYKVLWSR